MVMSINKLMRPVLPEYMGSPKFKAGIEQHIDFLRNHSSTQVVALDPANVYHNEGDLVGYLNNAKIEAPLHWIIMRMNHIYKNEQFKDMTQILVPAQQVVSDLRKAIVATYV